MNTVPIHYSASANVEITLIPYINKRKCAAVKDFCIVIQACPNGCFSYYEDEKEPLGGRIILDKTACIGCGVCAEKCCGKAIEMK